MNRRQFISIGGTAIATTLAGCGRGSTASADSEVLGISHRENPSLTTYVTDHRDGTDSETIELSVWGALSLETVWPTDKTGADEDAYDPIDVPDGRCVVCVFVNPTARDDTHGEDLILPPVGAWSLLGGPEDRYAPIQASRGAVDRYLFRDDDGYLTPTTAYDRTDGSTRGTLAFIADREHETVALEYDPNGVEDRYEWSTNPGFEYDIQLER